MARQPGARTQVAFAFESVYGTPPASGYRRMPFATTNCASRSRSSPSAVPFSPPNWSPPERRKARRRTRPRPVEPRLNRPAPRLSGGVFLCLKGPNS